MNNQNQFAKKLSLNNLSFELNQEIKKYTTWNIGGPADFLVKPKNSKELKTVIKLCLENEISFVILGKGSNILISDEGLRGVVIINFSRRIVFLDTADLEKKVFINDVQEYSWESPYVPPRHSETGDKSFYSFTDLDFEESGHRLKVKFDSGVFLPYAIAWSLKNKLTGLQWFAGIPGSLGGSLYNNIHGGTHHFSEYFLKARVLIPVSDVEAVSKVSSLNNLGENKILEKNSLYYLADVGFDYFEFGYDQSFLRRENNQVVVLDLVLSLFKSSQETLEKARFTAKEWANRKRLQPKNSCGSVFQALTPEDQQRLSLPTPSVGYVIDKLLGMRGEVKGGVQISDKHANFIINNGGGTASEVLFLIREIQIKARELYGLELKPEINFLGFKT